MSPQEVERLRTIGRELDNVREHLTAIKGEIAVIEKAFDDGINKIARIVEKEQATV